MKTILDIIVEKKRGELLRRKMEEPLNNLKEKALYHRTPVDHMKYMNDERPNIIAEFKRKSPSKGLLTNLEDPVPVVAAYQKAGAVISSVLTDSSFFGGSFEDLEDVKNSVVGFPLLRKDFMIDPYQLHEAKAYGADIILLIASILDKKQVRLMASEAVSLGLEVLLEVHNEEEVDYWVPDISMIGVNNRNLKDFSVDINRSLMLLPKLPKEVFKVSESGLHEVEAVMELYDVGYQGFLMGERFMKEEDPGAALAAFYSAIKKNKL